MPIADIIIINILLAFALAGAWFGFIHTLGSSFGTIIGIYLASRYYEPLANWLIRQTGWGNNVTRVVVFIIAFIIINRLVGFLFWIVEKFVNIVTYLPFIRSLNRILGLFLGFAEGVITVGLIIYFLAKFPLSQPIMDAVAQSKIAPYTIQATSFLLPLLPEALRVLRSSVDYVESLVR